jgi:replicative DNA helicase
MITEFNLYLEKFKTVNKKQYYNVVKDVFGENMIDLIKMSDDEANRRLSKFNTELKFLKSEYGDIYFVYGETNDEIMIANLMTANRKLNKEDFKKSPELINDINELIQELCDKVINGKTIYTFPNNFSEKILNNKIINKLKKEGFNVVKKIFHEVETPDGKIYKEMRIYIKK